MWLVNARNAVAMDAALLAMLEAHEGAVEVIWACRDLPALRGIVLEAAAARRLRVSGMLDETFQGPAAMQEVMGNVDQRLLKGLSATLDKAK